MHELMGGFLRLDLINSLQVVFLGLVGGILSGFIGSGGAFFMTPGMMNLGVSGITSVASNITHKFGKAMMGSKKHGELGNVDKKLSMFLLVTSFIGIRLAVWINTMLGQGGGSHGEGGGSPAGDLYISLIFVGILSLVSISILMDVKKTSKDESTGPSRVIVDFFSKLKLKPLIYFPVADVKVSLWLLLIVGLATGYLAGTIGVGGFIGVPAMIYVFGISATVAAGTELYLAMFMGGWGALNYAFEGAVDIRLTMLLYLGSLVGIYIGVYGTKVVKEVVIRLVTAIIIILCVFSRAIAIPMYLRQLGWVDLNPAWDVYFNEASKILLYVAGITGVSIILYNIIRAYVQQSKIKAALSLTAK